MKINFNDTFKNCLKLEFPEWDELHKAVDNGDFLSVSMYLEDARRTYSTFDPNDVLKLAIHSNVNQELKVNMQIKAAKALRLKRLTTECSSIFNRSQDANLNEHRTSEESSEECLQIDGSD